MNVAVQMAAVSAPTWVPCVNVTQVLGQTTPVLAAQVCTTTKSKSTKQSNVCQVCTYVVE